MNLSTILTVCHNSVRCVTTDFEDFAALSGRADDFAICDTHGGGIQILCIRVTSAQKYSVSARRYARNRRVGETPGVAA
jgi:hypothetical protein